MSFIFTKFTNSSLSSYVGVAAFGGIAVGIMGLMATSARRRKLTNLPFRDEALKILYQNKIAMELLGEPIGLKAIDASDATANYANDDVGQLFLPMKGTKNSGTLFVKANKLGTNWSVNRVELSLDGDLKSRTFLIYKSQEKVDGVFTS
ncbi:hypothetical protein HDE_14199 [Halotydeus destructor]|nr:hypothetical protein HDE_14199 [Halotydeus destructor]